MKLSVVTTIFKTARCILPFYERVSVAARELGMDFEVVFVNDGSPDNGLELALNAARTRSEIVVVDLSRNYGQHKAIWAGLRVARGDLIAIFDGDLEEDPGLVVPFYEALRNLSADVVFGIAREPKGSFMYRRSRDLFYWLLRRLSSIDFPRNAQTARLMSRRYVEALLLFEEREIFLIGIMHMAGFRQSSLLIDKPSLSQTTYRLRQLVWMAVNAVTAFSIAPLILIFVAGAGLFGASLLFLGYLVVIRTFNGVGVPGWTSVMALQMFSFSIIVLFLGIISIYIGTIFIEVKRRPSSIIRSVTRNGDKQAL